MSKESVLKVMDPPTATNALVDKLPSVEVLADVKDTGKRAMTEVRQVSLRTRKTIADWWRKLPNDGIRAGMIAGAALVIGLIPALVVIYRRRNAP
jgi:hypothetical protein